jgi:hypothetical protein
VIEGDPQTSTKFEESEEQEVTPKFADEPSYSAAEATPEDVVLVEEAKEEENVLVITD